MTIMTQVYTIDLQRPLLLAACGVGGQITEGHRQKRR
jgi:hypothetical protein